MGHLPLLLTTHQLILLPTTNPPNPMLSNTVLPMTTLEVNSAPKRPLTARPSPDPTKWLFPMAASKLLHILLITTTVISLMSNTKVPLSTPKPSLTTLLPHPLTTLPPSPLTTLKKQTEANDIAMK